MTWLAAWAFVKNAAGGLFGFLKSLNGWQLVCLALALFGAVQTVRVWSEQRHSAKVEKQLSETVALVNQLRAQSKQQQQTVTKTIDHYITVTKPEVRTIVQKVESAPLPGGCKTPQAVLDADV
jgi:hypothetical protein